MNKRIYLITGCNRGIGKGLVEELLKQSNPNKHIILSSRTKENTDKTVEELAYKYKDSKTTLEGLTLNVENMTDIRLAHNYIQTKYSYLSVLINNAAFLVRGAMPEQERLPNIIRTMSVNFFAQVMLTNSLLPLILNSTNTVTNTNTNTNTAPQIIFLSSLIGRRTFKDKSLNAELENADLAVLESMYNRYITDIRNGKESNWDYTLSKEYNAYGPSKVFLNAYMRHLSKSDALKDKVMVNSFNPGWVRTDMGGSKAPLSVEEGCRTGMFLDGVKEFVTGKVWEDNKEFRY